ncbi:MAG: putative phosphohydrolase [Phormidesmis priestleyi Ana]|uniref:Putative phosphohydrolase n=1 Tax=Phormidesmis priestleyi Ana TaxID=1666911 RepID=A0A0P8BG42_9CYAN|nr:MAG: putative phosphohydrolase [Phormidesmis priestleyi Ana]
MKSLIRFFKYAAVGLIGTVVLLTVCGLIEPRFVNRVDEIAQIPNLPPEWEGKKVVQLSDFQVGLWLDNSGTAKRAVQRAIEAEPSVVLISGDFIYHPGPNSTDEIETAVEIVRPLIESGIPTYAVLGNHDYGMGSKTADPDEGLAMNLKVALEDAGIVVLENESVEMTLPDSTGINRSLYLAAVGSLWAGKADISAALSNIPEDAPRVALMHNPDSYENFPPSTAPLAVAGHTHGGQIRLPNSPQVSWLRFTQRDEVHADGWAQGYGAPGNKLYVNVGIGMSIVPIRIFCPPELTIFTLE